MGTSKAYGAPTTPQWSAAKRTVSNAIKRDGFGDAECERMLQAFVDANGGAAAFSRGGGTSNGSRAAQDAASNLGGFGTAVGRSGGLIPVLQGFGLASPQTLTGRQLANFLADHLCGNGGTLDDANARRAMGRLMHELLDEYATFDEAREAIESAIEGGELGDWIAEFLGYYVFEAFCETFHEGILKRVEAEKTDDIEDRIQIFIAAAVARLERQGGLERLTWPSAQADAVVQAIFRDLLDAFDVEDTR